jgi:CRP-like cAMP-binding protein
MRQGSTLFSPSGKERMLSSVVKSVPNHVSAPVRPSRPRGVDTEFVRVLDEDPDLAAGLSGERLEHARSRLVAGVARRAAGELVLPRVSVDALGFLILDGVVVREVLMEDTVSAELLGAGDLLRRPHPDHSTRLLRSNVRSTVLQPVRIAVLGARCAAAVGAFPEVNGALFDRVTERAERLAVTQAICQLNGVDRRVLALLWHMAERWGRVAGDGIVVPLALPHRVIASLVGARRPTVSTAVARLSELGTVERRVDGAWLLHGEPVGLPTAATSRFVPVRRPRGAKLGIREPSG